MTENIAITWILMASYAYYLRDTTIMSDEYYDTLFWWLQPRLGNVWKGWENRVALIPKNAEKSSLYMLTDDDYPTRIKDQCDHFLRTRADSSVYLNPDMLKEAPPVSPAEEDPFAKFF